MGAYENHHATAGVEKHTWRGTGRAVTVTVLFYSKAFRELSPKQKPQRWKCLLVAVVFHAKHVFILGTLQGMLMLDSFFCLTYPICAVCSLI